MGAVLGAVSPAIVVPRMVQLIENGWGTKKSIPQLILAGASSDDIFVIVLFSTFVRMAQAEQPGPPDRQSGHCTPEPSVRGQSASVRRR